MLLCFHTPSSPPRAEYPGIVQMGSHGLAGSRVTAGFRRGDGGHRVDAELCCAGGRGRWHVRRRVLRLWPHLPQEANDDETKNRERDEIKRERADRERV